MVIAGNFRLATWTVLGVAAEKTFGKPSLEK